MSYQEQANKINEDLKNFFSSDVQTLTKEQKEFILNMIIQVGQVAKFRCRSNVAYDNFISSCFSGIADCKRVGKNPDDEWLALRAFIMEVVVPTTKEEPEKEKMIRCPNCYREQPESLGACEFCMELYQEWVREQVDGRKREIEGDEEED